MTRADGTHELDSRPQSHREWSGWLRSIVLPLGLVVAIVGGLLYYQSRGGEEADDGFGTVELPAELNATGRAPAAEVGRTPPDFLLQTLDGSTLRLSSLRGRPLVVNYWATWCGPCRQEMPDLVLAYREHRDAGLTILAVNQREANDRVQPFVDEFTLPFPILMDRRGEVASTWQVGGPMAGLPSTYFIDRDGIVQKVVDGGLTARTLSEGLDLILGSDN